VGERYEIAMAGPRKNESRPVSMNRQPREGQSIPTMGKAKAEKIDVWL